MSRNSDAFTGIADRDSRSIADAFAGRKAFIAYLMAGDPNLEASGFLILAAQKAGADLIEVGIPFSDPIAEGEVIMAASARALAAGTRLDGVFSMLDSLQGRLRVPLVFMTYLNPVFAYGYERFCARSAEVGVSGLIIPDLPFEEQGELKPIARRFGLEVVSLVAPTSASRILRIAEAAEGFIYLVSSLGVTGMRSGVSDEISALVAAVRQVSTVPVAVGFGISTPEQAAFYAAMADGVIVGSAIVDIVGRYGEKAEPYLVEYITGMKAGLG